MKIATWKVRLMNITDKTQTIAGEMKKYGVDYKVLIGNSRSERKDTGQKSLTSGEIILYTGQ